MKTEGVPSRAALETHDRQLLLLLTLVVMAICAMTAIGGDLLLIALLFGVAAAVFALVQPFALVILLGLLIPLEWLQSFPGSDLTGTKIVAGALFAVTVVRKFAVGRFELRRTPLDAPILLFAAVFLLQWWRVYPDPQATKVFMSMCMYAGLYYLLQEYLADERSLGWATWALVASTTAVAAVSCAAAIIGDLVATAAGLRGDIAEELRAIGTFEDPNRYATLLLIVLGIVLPRAYMHERVAARGAAALAATVLLVGIYFTFSRSAWLAVVAMLGAGLLLRKSRALLILLAIALLFILAPYAWSLVGQRLGFGITHGTDRSLVARSVQWSLALETMDQWWLWGLGVEQQERFIQSQPSQRLQIRWGVHCVPLLLWMDLGLGGLIALAWLVFRLGTTLWRTWRLAGRRGYVLEGWMLAVLGYLVVTLMQPFYRLVVLPYCAALAVAAARLALQRHEAETSECGGV